MFADRLKKSLLQAAIQGQLTEQLPTDGDARDLLRKIRTEKAKLIAAKKIKAEKPLPPVTVDEIPFDIPDNWCWVRLSEVCQMYTGDSIAESEKKAKYRGLVDGFSYIGTKDISFDNQIDYDNGICIPFENNFRRACSGSVLMCIEGGSAGRKIAVTDREVRFGNKLCNFNANKVSNRYIYFYLQSPMFQKSFRDNVTGMIGGVNLRRLNLILLPLPPFAEQERIVEKLNALMSEVDELVKDERELVELEKNFPRRMRNSLLQAAIQGKLTEQLQSDGDARDLLRKIRAKKAKLFAEKKIKAEKSLPPIKDDEIPFDLPDNWCWCRLGDVCEMYTGNSIAEFEKKSKYLGLADGFSYIGTKDISFDSRIDYDNGVCIPFENNFRQAKKNSVLMCIEGGSAGRKIAITDRDVCFGNKLCNFNADKISNEYIYYYLQSPTFLKFFRDNVTGMIGGVSLKRLNSILLLLPPLAEQKRILKKLNELLPLCTI